MRLRDDEISAHKKWLSEWHEPAAMLEFVDQIMICMGSADLFAQAGIEYLRDAWLAAKFAQKRAAEGVRLIPDEWPDFEIQLKGRIERFECVEADLPQRRRGQEYKEAEIARLAGVLVEDDPVEAWVERAEQVPAMLASAIKRKLEKHYAGRVHLLIYLNVEEFGIRQHEIEAAFRTSTAAARGGFESVWILWKEQVYRPW